MRILAVSDKRSPSLYDYYSEGDGEFLVTLADVPLLYVHGNHDDHFKREPEGCVCIDDKFYEYNGVRFVGLGGCYRYKEGKYMYTERKMKLRVQKLWLKIRRHHGFDVLVTHAPAWHLNDFDNLTHRGFNCFNTLLDKFKPKLFFHGHVHTNYGARIPRKCEHNGTVVINATDHYILEIDI